MTEDEHALLTARNAYSYPWVYIEALSSGDRGGLPVAATEAQVVAMSEQGWADRHAALLSNQDEHAAVLGLVSLNYWGYYGSAVQGRRPTAERAMARARWVRDGRPHHAKPRSFAQMRDNLALANAALAEGRIADALRAVNCIGEFGQMSFGSKVLMALNPEACGVYDKVIYEALLRAGNVWRCYLAFPNAGMSGPKAAVYALWCEMLAHRASHMNALMDSGLPAGWGTVDASVGRRWRPVDVERAFFRVGDVALLGEPLHPAHRG